MKNLLILSLLSTATSAATLNFEHQPLESENAAYMELWNELAAIEEAEE